MTEHLEQDIPRTTEIIGKRGKIVRTIWRRLRMVNKNFSKHL